MRTILFAVVAVLCMAPRAALAQTSTSDLAKTSSSQDIAAFYNAQAAHDDQGAKAALDRVAIRKIAALLHLTADRLVLEGRVLHAQGSVTISVNGTTIEANDATIPLDLSQDGQLVHVLDQIQIDNGPRVTFTAPIAIPTSH